MIHNLDVLPFPARDLVLNCDYTKYRGHYLSTARGCPYACSFCSDKRFWGKNVRRRSVENVIGFCAEYCGKCPSYEGTGETALAFCTLGKSSIIHEQRGCLCAQCPISRTMSLRWDHYCVQGKAMELSEAENR